MNQNLKVIVAHPNKQHSFQTAIGLNKEGILFKYITTVYDSKKSILMRLTKKLLKAKDLKKANTRYCDEIDENKILQKYELFGLFTLLIFRLFKSKNIFRFFSRKLNNLFGKSVARYAIKNNVDMVIMYDTTAASCFRYLKKNAPNIKRVLDMSIASREYSKIIYDKEIENTKSNQIFIENKYIWNKNYIKDYNEEIKLADYFLSPSTFVSKSIKYFDIDDNKILNIPYGVNENKFKVEKKRKDVNLPIKLLFVGQVNARKGIPHLLEAVEKFDKEHVELNLVGGYDDTSDMYNKYKNFDNIKFLGFKNLDEIVKIYEKSDVFVLPSLSEGMALVGFEAMSMQLPLICTTNTGINDIIEDYVSGIIIQPGKTEEIEKAIKWFIKNRDKIQIMGEVAKDKVKEYTWAKYHKRLAEEIKKIGVKSEKDKSCNLR